MTKRSLGQQSLRQRISRFQRSPGKSSLAKILIGHIKPQKYRLTTCYSVYRRQELAA